MNQGIHSVAAGRFGCSLRYSKLRHFEGNKDNSGLLALKYIVSGDALYAWKGKEISLRPGSYLLLPDDCTYHTSFKAHKPVEGLCLNLHTDFFKAVYTSLRCSDTELLDNPDDILDIEPAFLEGAFPCRYDTLAPALSFAAQAGKYNSIIEDEAELYYGMATALARSQAAIGRKLQRIKADKPSTRQELLWRILFATGYIHDNYPAKMSVEELALLAQMSPFHFMRVFRQVMDTSVHQYILRIRLEQAMTLIKKGGNSLTAIAQSTGFPDLPSFCKAFKKRFGCTPGSLV